MNPKRAKEIVSQFAGKRLLVIGDVMLDRYVFGKVERINPEAPVPILEAQDEQYATGGAGNVAKNAATLGAKAVLVSVVGNDVMAHRLREAIAGEGYAAELVVDDMRPTTEKIRYVVGGQQILRVDYEERQHAAGAVEEGLIEKIKESARECDAIIVSDYAKGVITQAVADVIMTLRQAQGDRPLPVMADMKPSRAAYFKGVTWISPNHKEAHEFLGIEHTKKDDMTDAELAEKLRAAFGATVFLTLGPNGMYVLGEEGGLPAGRLVPQIHTIEVADTSGCGDTAAVAIVLAKLSGATDVEAAELGNAAGAIVASRVGAVGVTPEGLLEMVESGSNE